MKKISSLFYALLLIFTLGCSRDESSGSSNDKCGKVSNVNFQAYASKIILNFSSGNNTNSYKIEYGPTGFSIGSGKSLITSNNSVEINELLSSTTYDVYITGICSSTETSSPYKLSSITTEKSLCTGDPSVQFYQYDTNEVILDFKYSNNIRINKYEIEYGISGFTPGTGTKESTSYGSSIITLQDLQLNKTYDFYVRAQCSEGDMGSYKKFTYTSVPTCPMPFQLNSRLISGSCYSGSATRSFTWASYGNPTSYTVSIVTDINGNPENGQTFTTSEKSIAIGNMFCLWKAFYVKSNCGGKSSQWAGPYIF